MLACINLDYNWQVSVVEPERLLFCFCSQWLQLLKCCISWWCPLETAFLVSSSLNGVVFAERWCMNGCRKLTIPKNDWSCVASHGAGISSVPCIFLGSWFIQSLLNVTPKVRQIPVIWHTSCYWLWDLFTYLSISVSMFLSWSTLSVPYAVIPSCNTLHPPDLQESGPYWSGMHLGCI